MQIVLRDVSEVLLIANVFEDAVHDPDEAVLPPVGDVELPIMTRSVIDEQLVAIICDWLRFFVGNQTSAEVHMLEG